MANQITDNRTLIANGDSTTGWDSVFGGAQGTLDTEIKLQGTGSIGYSTKNSKDGLLFDMGSAQNWANNTFYLWINCAIVGILDTKANGGMAIRFAGATFSDFFEVYVGGSDSWPTSVEGGWTQFVVSIEDARTAALGGTLGQTGGTTPATSAIRYVGFASVTDGTMPRMIDNTWIDEVRRLPASTPGIIVEGRNGGTTDWDFSDIVSQLGIGAGTLKNGPGGSFVLNTPLQIGINDSSIHGFSDSNQVVLWDDQEFAAADLYNITVLGGAGGTTNVTLGQKTGTGDAATGAQGVVFSASSGGVRWSFDADDTNVDAVNLYGCSFIHGDDFQFDSSAVSVISSLYVDCVSASVANSEQLKNKVINAGTADATAFMTTDDLSDIIACDFEFSDGHAVELATPLTITQSSDSNTFSGYGAIGTNDAAIFNDQGGAVTINVLNGGDTPTYRNGTSASTTVNNTVAVTVTVRSADTADPIENARVLLEADSGGDLTAGTVILSGLTNASGVIENTGFNFTSLQPVTGKARKASSSPRFITGPISGSINSGGFDVTVFLVSDE